MPDFSQVQQFPDLNFVDASLDSILAAEISTYEQTYLAQTGKQVTVQPGDDVYILLRAQALREYSILQSFNFADRQNFIKYAAANNLDNLAANTGCVRSESTAAVTTMQLSVGKAQAIDITIPMGTRVTPGNSLYFATDEKVILPAGNTAVTVSATCLTVGKAGNGYVPGQINVLVDPVSYISAVANIDTSEGGSETEDDLSLAEKTFGSPEGFSVAGPTGAYDYFARQYSPAVIDTKTTSPSAGVVNMRVLLTGGAIPNQAFLSDLQNYIGDRDKRPLTDNFSVTAPDIVNYTIELTYYINSSDAGNAQTIQNAVNAAVQNYISWQKGALGRDINPDELTYRIKAAGAKRAEITSPTFTQVAETAVAVADTSSIAVTDGGVDSV